MTTETPSHDHGHDHDDFEYDVVDEIARDLLAERTSFEDVEGMPTTLIAHAAILNHQTVAEIIGEASLESLPPTCPITWCIVGDLRAYVVHEIMTSCAEHVDITEALDVAAEAYAEHLQLELAQQHRRVRGATRRKRSRK